MPAKRQAMSVLRLRVTVAHESIVRPCKYLEYCITLLTAIPRVDELKMPSCMQIAYCLPQHCHIFLSALVRPSGIVKPTDNDFFLLIMTLSFTDNDFLFTENGNISKRQKSILVNFISLSVNRNLLISIVATMALIMIFHYQ